jgi:hypothetical protein
MESGCGEDLAKNGKAHPHFEKTLVVCLDLNVTISLPDALPMWA